ncbi:MAG: ATP-binding cassette domain-containing protein [Chloroflexi bacterium]|nr:ATP-binding cassette domain-containing protein [Chloroflexota bacterium]
MIEVQHLSKYYGSYPAVEDVSFQVNKGEIVGLLGPNAAGKTTTMRVITGFLPPTNGVVRVNGYDIVSHSLEARRHIGYLPETVPLYTEMTVREYLTYMGALRGMGGARLKSRLDDVVGICRLEDYVDSHIAKLSKGFRQRVGIAQAIIHQPTVLVLDEPTIGIDPIQVVETRQVIRDLSSEQRAIILSTHILPEVSMICGRVLIINEGRLIAEDTPANLATRLRGASQVVAEIRGPAKTVLNALQDGLKDVKDIRREGTEDRSSYYIDCKPGIDCREQLATLVVENGWGLLGLQTRGMSLEEIFLELTVGEENE